MDAVILAGGLGTRMKPFTEKIPKWLIPVQSKPFAEIQINYLVDQGVRNILVCVGHLSELIRTTIPSGDPWGIQLRYVEDGDTLLGTAGALRKALDRQLLPEYFLLMYGDSFLPIDFGNFWKFAYGTHYRAVMTVLENGDRWDQSNVAFDVNEKRILRYDKNEERRLKSGLKYSYIDYGLSFLRASLIEEFVSANQKMDLTDIFYPLSRDNGLGAYEVRERFYEIGSPSGLAELEYYLGGQ